MLIRRELENAAKDLQDRVRMGIASAEEYFELGAVMLRKRLYIQANRYLEQAIQKWEGDPEELAQVRISPPWLLCFRSSGNEMSETC